MNNLYFTVTFSA